MKYLSITVLLLLIVPAVSCKTSRDPEPHPECGHPFFSKTWGVSLCLKDSFTYRKGGGIQGDRIFFGPKTDWPFYDKYHPYMLKPVACIDERGLLARLGRLEKKNVGDTITGASPQQNVWVRKINTYRVKDVKVVSFYRSGRHAQCEEVVHTVIGKRYNYEITYPCCGGAVGDIFHFDSGMYFKDLIATMEFVE